MDKVDINQVKVIRAGVLSYRDNQVTILEQLEKMLESCEADDEIGLANRRELIERAHATITKADDMLTRLKDLEESNKE